MKRVLIMKGNMPYGWGFVGEAPHHYFSEQMSVLDIDLTPPTDIPETVAYTPIFVMHQTELRRPGGYVDFEIWQHMDGDIEKASAMDVEPFDAPTVANMLNRLTKAGYFQ